MTNTTKTTHKSGLRLISHHMPDAPSVALNIFVRTGSRYENDKNNGVAHFFEHMVFKGTPKRPSPYQVSYDLESIGADINAATEREYTTYYLKVLKGNFEKGSEILFDAFLHSLLDEEELNKERSVVKEEMKMYDDDPSSYADDKFVENLYVKDPYGRNIIGTNETLDYITPTVMRDFYNANYFLENTVISAAGDITHEELESLVDRYFDFEIYTHGENIDRDYFNDVIEQDVFTYTKEVQQAQLRMATFSQSYYDADKYKNSVAMSILGSGMASKLFIEVRVKRGLAYSVYAYSHPWSKSGYSVISAGLIPDKIEEVQSICIEEMKKLADGNFTLDDLNRAKELSKASLLLNIDTTEDWAWFLGKNECVYNKLMSIDEIIESIDKVNTEDVKNMMIKLSSVKWQSTIVKPTA